MLTPENIERIKLLKIQCEEIYPDKEGALSMMLGILAASKLWEINFPSMIKKGVIPNNFEDPKYREYMNAFISGGKCMYETSVSGQLELLILELRETLNNLELGDNKIHPGD